VNRVFDIYIHGYVKGGVGWEAVRRAYMMINSAREGREMPDSYKAEI